MTPDDIGLCTLEDVRELMGTPTSDTRRDARVADLIVRASAMVMQYTQREFAPGGAQGLEASGARIIDNPERDCGMVDFPLSGWDLDKTAEVTVEFLSFREEVPDLTASSSSYRLVGRRGEPVYHTITASVPRAYVRGIRVTADRWGWPIVLPDVREATAMTVAHLMTSFPAAGRPDPMGIQPAWEPRGLPRTAYDVLARYKVGA